MQLLREPMLYHFSAPLKLLSLLLIILVCALFILIFGMAAGYLFYGNAMMDYMNGSTSFTDPGMLSLLKYLQIINTLGLFLFPPILFAWLADRKPAEYLTADSRPLLISTVAGVCIIVTILPFLHWTAGINEMMQLPVWMSGLENWMKKSEAQAAEITALFLGTTSLPGLLINLLMIAVLPSIGEEFLFRGILVRLFREWTGKVHLSVIITALLFSALHLQFYGFLPRFILGLILGYLFVWTRSIWVPVIVHFFNNGFAVVAAWFHERGNIATDAESLGSSDKPYLIIASFLMVVVLLSLVSALERKKKGSTLL